MFFKLTSISIAALLIANAATAQTATPKAPEPNYTISYNLGVTSDYRYRGISQSRLKPALQGGIDYANKNGFYVGTWASTIKWIKDAGTIANVDAGASPVEIDLYGGYKFEAAKDLTLDFGALQYLYTGNKYSVIANSSNANTLEFYGAASYGIFTAKYSRSQTNLFGAGGSTLATNVSKGSGYLDSYTDYSLTLNKDFDGLVLSGAFVAANTKNNGAYAYASPTNQNLGKGAIVVSLKKNF
jgi:uncharacterized protein (TIGR02001 family)